MVAVQKTPANDKAVIQKAFNRAGLALGLTQIDLGEIIGKDRQTVSREPAPNAFMPNSKSGEAALNFIRIYRSLSALMGEDNANMRHWLNTHNRHLGSIPRSMLSRTQDLIRVVIYLDAMRGKM